MVVKVVTREYFLLHSYPQVQGLRFDRANCGKASVIERRRHVGAHWKTNLGHDGLRFEEDWSYVGSNESCN